MWKWIKRTVLVALACGGLGFFFFGSDALSYMTSSGRMLTRAVKESVPVEFEIKRARDLLEQLVPETHALLEMVAREEVEIAHLEKEIHRERQDVEKERRRVTALRGSLGEEHASYRFGAREYSRSEVLDELARRFEHLRTAELVLAGKQKLLQNRKANLQAGIEKLEKTRVARLELAAQIEALESQFRLVEAQGSASKFNLDDSKLAQTQRLIGDLRKRLEVAQKVLAREARFVETIPVEEINEKSLLETVDAHLAETGPAAGAGAAARASVTY